MEIVELALTNFRMFADGRFGFCAGLNVFCGPNESGKSTIHEAISCALFGRERNREVASWSGGPCSMSLTYRSEGKLFQIERRLTESASRLGTPNGGDLSDVITVKDEIESFIASHLGIASREVFENTVSVRQTDMSKPDASDMTGVGSEIQRVLTGTAHVSAAEVLNRLEARRSATKGKARPVNPREYDMITSRLHELAKELADARRSRERIRNLEDELSELEARNARDSERFEVLGGLLGRRKRWSELKKRDSELETLHKDVFSTVKKIKNTLADLSVVQRDLADYADLVGKDEEIYDHLSKTESRRTELAARLAELEAAGAELDPSRLESKATWMLASAALFVIAALVVGFLLGRKAGFMFDPWGFPVMAPAVLFAAKYIQMKASGRDSESRRVAELMKSATSELNQLDAEEDSILSYVKCRDASKALARIRNYRSLMDRAHELDVTLNTLLGGKKIDALEAQEADLDRELSGIRRELQEDFEGYAPTAEESESWRSEFAALQSSLPAAQARLHEVCGSLEAERKNARDLAAIEGEMEFLHHRKGELDFLYKAYDEAIAALNAIMETVSAEYVPELSKRAGDYLASLTSGRYTSVCVGSGWEITTDCRDKSAVQPQMLSIGTQDQLHLALRIACGELLASGRKLPVILDDPFASFDRDRLDNALDMLASLAASNQIVLLTHDLHVLDWAKGLEKSGRVPCVVHELAGPD